MTRSVRLALAAGCFLLQGCWGPHFDPEEPELPRIVAGEKITAVVVGNFRQSRKQVSETQSGNIVTVRESLSAHDVSFNIASGIRDAGGIPARPIKNADPSILRPGEVLVRGSIRASERQFIGTSTYIQFGITIGTLGMYGVMMPYFYPFKQGSRVDVNVEIVDRGGNVILAKNQRVNVFNKSFHIATWFDDTDAPPALRMLQKKVAAAIARAITSASVGGPAPDQVRARPRAPRRAPLSPVQIAKRAKPPGLKANKTHETLLLNAARGEDGLLAINLVANAVVYGVNINTTTDALGRTALIIAAATGKVKLVEYLLSGDLAKIGAHVDKHVRDNAGQTALDHARAKGHTAIVRMLEK